MACLSYSLLIKAHINEGKLGGKMAMKVCIGGFESHGVAAGLLSSPGIRSVVVAHGAELFELAVHHLDLTIDCSVLKGIYGFQPPDVLFVLPDG